MKFLPIILSIILFVINPIKASDIKIVYIDTDKILNESIVGKNVKKQLDSINKKNVSKFEQVETNLIEEEKKISQHKNTLSKEELQPKAKNLQNLLKVQISKEEASEHKNILKKIKNTLWRKIDY